MGLTFLLVCRKAQISFVNAVLRNIDREGRPRLEATSTIDNLDPWIAKQFIKQYGEDTTNTLVEAAMSQSPVFITTNQLLKQGGESHERLEQMKDIL